MYWTKTIFFVLAMLSSGAPSGFALDRVPMPDQDPRDLAALAKIDFATAVRTAVGQRAGHVTEVELEAGESSEGPTLVWEIDVVTGDGLVEVTVDAIGGGVVGVETEDEEEELEVFRRVLRHAEKSLEELAAAAAEVIRGKVVSAVLEIDDGQPVAEFVIANGRYLVEVAVEARAGHVVEIEMISDLRGGDDDDDEEEEEEEEEEEDEEEDEDR